MIGSISQNFDYSAYSKPAQTAQPPQDSSTEETGQVTAPTTTTGQPEDSKTDSSKDSNNEEANQKQREIEELKRRESEVIRHEQAHIAAGGGQIRSGANYTYETGPDGEQYAAGGEVSIDVSEGRTPEETLQKAETIRRAALAPANPSSQDRRIAAKASAMAQEAQQEKAKEQQEAPSPDASTPDAKEVETERQSTNEKNPSPDSNIPKASIASAINAYKAHDPGGGIKNKPSGNQRQKLSAVA